MCMYVDRFVNIILRDDGCASVVSSTKGVVDNPQLSRRSVISTTYQISCSNEVFEADLKTSRVICIVVSFPGSRHFACNDFVATTRRGWNLWRVNRDFRGDWEGLCSGRAPN